eukprot:3498207-Prymnesium_polylepis.1
MRRARPSASQIPGRRRAEGDGVTEDTKLVTNRSMPGKQVVVRSGERPRLVPRPRTRRTD